jgi:hypothetical protein
MGVHLDDGGGDAPPGSVRQIALARGGEQAEADVDASEASVDADPRVDPVGLERQDAGAADRADVAD